MISEYFSANIDDFDLITKAGDGGDTCCRHFTALYCLPHTRAEAEHALNLLQAGGIPIRHPDSTKWYCTTDRTSRDQLIPYLCYTAAYAPQAFKSLATAHAKRLFALTWNCRRNFVYPTLEAHERLSTPDVPWNYAWKLPDICFASVWAVYVRGFMQHTTLGRLLRPLLYVLLHVLDLHKAADICILYVQLGLGRQIGPTWQTNSIDHDMSNSVLPAHYSATHYPTFISYISWKLLKPWGNVAAKSFFQQPEEPRLDLAIKALK